jgi:hypothetical protein
VFWSLNSRGGVPSGAAAFITIGLWEPQPSINISEMFRDFCNDWNTEMSRIFDTANNQ